MARNSISQKSNKGVQLGRVTTVQPKAPASDSKVKLSEPATALTHERIAERAKVIWQNRGCRPGEDKRNWSEAEAQLKAELGID